MTAFTFKGLPKHHLVALFMGLAVLGVTADAQTTFYDLPNNDADCPGNCRQIPWKAGSDVWNGGTLPNFPSVACSGLTEGDGTTDNTSAIQACINAAALDTAVYVPPGMYYVNAPITLRSRVVLRGAGGGRGSQGTWISSTYHGDVGPGSTVTTLKFGPSGYIRTPGSSTLSTPVSLAGGFNKGSTSVTTSTSPGVSAGDWIVIAQQQGDTSIPVTWTGANGNCTWCGESNNSGYLMSQIVQVTSVSGSTIGISRPLYYTFKSSLNPRLRKLNIGGQRTGVENMKLWGSSNSRRDPHISVDGCMQCWVKGVETYNTPDVGKAYPVYIEYSYANEIRDSYFHYGQGNSGDRNYGIGMFGPNSDHKVENNIYRENRHSWSQEGGGSGNVFLYNYVDDNYTNDTSFLGSPRVNHGAHPYMTLFEGNIVSHFASDNFWGSSSHVVIFRNWLWGDATGNYPAWAGGNPDWGFVALEIDRNQHFYSAVGNVLGNTTLHTNWSSATLMNSSCGYDSPRSAPVVYGFGCVSQSGTFDSGVRSTMILHGNYDFKTGGIAHWDGGAAHTLRPSMYYSSKPGFFGSCDWPAFGSDVPGLTKTIPAKERFAGASTCDGTSTTPPTAPTNLRIIR
jgi:hypothetical protein